MHYLIKIDDKNDDSNFSLINVLKAIVSIGSKYKWSLYRITAEGKLPNKLPYGSTASDINKSPTGLHLHWDELVTWAKEVTQIIEMSLVASEKEIEFTKQLYTEQWRMKNPLMIIVEDGRFWEISTERKEVVDIIKEIYTGDKSLIKVSEFPE